MELDSPWVHQSLAIVNVKQTFNNFPFTSIPGIDYGVAFGSSLLNCPIPELMVFRLTPQLVDAVTPLETSGIIKKSMIHALRTLRNDTKLLMACMEVFVKEPTINWLHSAWEKEQAGGHEIAPVGDVDWEPNMRIEMARRKLNGSNPMQIMKDELKSGIIGR